MKIYNLRNLKPQQREYQEVKDEVREREREISNSFKIELVEFK